jgi:transcriptional regulator
MFVLLNRADTRESGDRQVRYCAASIFRQGRVHVYLPDHFAETDPERIRALIAEYPLGTLVTVGGTGLSANHIPFLLDDRSGPNGTLVGHVARRNDAWHDRDPKAEVLVIFQGPSAYITPNWYLTKEETHEVVPTWNYAVVHVYGRVIVHENAKWLRGLVGRLTKTMESAEPVPWKMGDAPQDFLNAQLAEIVGIEIQISRIIGKWKVSQNRPEADRSRVVIGLRSRDHADDAAMADLVDTARTSPD